MAKSNLKLVTPATVKRTVAPGRRPNADLRTREYLTEAEVERLLKAYLAHRTSPEETFLTFARRHDGETLRRLADAQVADAEVSS